MAGRFIVLSYLFCQFGAMATPDPMESATYDQRQSGHYNIHISIKDVAIFDLEGNDFADKKPGLEDYYYDDNDFTIKPLGSYMTSKPTSKPTISTTDTPLQSSSTTEALSTSQNLTFSVAVESVTSPGGFSKANETSSSNNYSMLQEYTDEIPKPMPSKKPSVMIINPAVPAKPERPVSMFPAHMGGLIPVQVITDPVQMHERRSFSKQPARLQREAPINVSTRDESNPFRRCRRGQMRDSMGHCRSRRSSFLGKMLKMIKSLNLSET